MKQAHIIMSANTREVGRLEALVVNSTAVIYYNGQLVNLCKLKSLFNERVLVF